MALGYKPGPADGLWGGRSAEAYRAFLRDAGLPPSDILTPGGMRSMRAIAKRRPQLIRWEMSNPRSPRRWEATNVRLKWSGSAWLKNVGN